MTHAARKILGLALGTLLVGSTSLAAFTSLDLDRVHSRVGFTAATLFFDVEGQFTDFTIEIDGDPDKPETVKVEVNIDVASIDTANATRDAHLRKPDFFDAAKYPKIRFTSTNVKQKRRELVVTGYLTMHGITELVSVPLEVTKGKNGAGVDTTTYKGSLTIDRNDYGIGTDSVAAKISLKDEVEIKLLIVALP